MTQWRAVRLQRLFSHYSKRYWRGRLPNFSMVIDNSMDPYGEIFFRKKLVRINLKLHKSDSSVRATVLHEMAHLAVGKKGHNSAFFSELERLLRRKAPIQVGFPENENRKWLDVIPTRFHMVRKKLQKPYANRQRWIERRIKKSKAQVEDLTPERVEQQAQDAALEGLIWKEVFCIIVEGNGLVDIDGKPLTWARPHINAAKRGYRRGRRSFREERDAEPRSGINFPQEHRSSGSPPG